MGACAYIGKVSIGTVSTRAREAPDRALTKIICDIVENCFVDVCGAVTERESVPLRASSGCRYERDINVAAR